MSSVLSSEKGSSARPFLPIAASPNPALFLFFIRSVFLSGYALRGVVQVCFYDATATAVIAAGEEVSYNGKLVLLLLLQTQTANNALMAAVAG